MALPSIPSIVRLPLHLGANVVTGVAKLALKPLQRGGEQTQQPTRSPTPVAERTPDPQAADAPATNPTAGEAPPAREGEEDRTVGRRSHERKDPTPQPAQGATAAQAGSRRASTPKTARAVRKRPTKADTLDTVASGAGSGKGGTPEAKAENTPKARARAGQGREAAPMGSQDDGGEPSS